MRDMYFVSYSYVGGFGCCETWMDNGGFKVKDFIDQFQKENPHLKNIVVLYFKRFEKGESYS
jgi:hypothetical protein